MHPGAYPTVCLTHLAPHLCFVTQEAFFQHKLQAVSCPRLKNPKGSRVWEVLSVAYQDTERPSHVAQEYPDL